MAEKAMNIYQKMLAATMEIGRVAKNLNVGFGQNSYRATGEADVLAAVRPVEEKYGIYSYPVSREIVDSGEMVSIKEYKGEKKESRQFYVRIATVYRFVNIDKPEEYIEITSYGDGVDSQDKSPGKGMTYADKYALLKAYKIMTGDDPDQNASEEVKSYTRKNPDAAPAAPATITEKEVAILREMLVKAGKEESKFYPKGLQNLPASRYSEAVQTLTSMIRKKEEEDKKE